MLGQSPQTAKGETSTGRIVAASQRSEGKRTYEARHQLPCTGPYSSWIQGLHVSSGQPVTRVVMRWWHGCEAHSGSQGHVRSPWCRRTRCSGGRWSRHRLSTGTHPALRNNTHTLVNSANGAGPMRAGMRALTAGANRTPLGTCVVHAHVVVASQHSNRVVTLLAIHELRADQQW